MDCSFQSSARTTLRLHLSGAVELCFCCGPTEVLEDGGHEERDSLHGDVDEEEAQRADVVCDVEHGALHVADLLLLVLGRARFGDEPQVRDTPLALGQEPAFRGGGGHGEGGCQPD